jgi:LuxR family maltose regulon positive regulatory protein
LAALDRASLRKVTVISAPPGSGKTSLLRSWTDRVSEHRRVAFMSVRHDEQDAQHFWLDVLDAIRQRDPTAESPRPAAAPDVEGDAMVDTVGSELAKAAGVVVLVIDDVHELSSGTAMSQLEYLLSALPQSARVVLSSRRANAVSTHWPWPTAMA